MKPRLIPLLLALAGAVLSTSGHAAAHHPRPAYRRGGHGLSAPDAAASFAARAESLEAALAGALDSLSITRAAALADSGVSLRELRPGLTPLALAAYLDSLGLRFSALSTNDGWAAAERYFRRSLDLKQRALGPRDLKVASLLGTLATLSDFEGHEDEAARLAERALAIRIARLGARDPAVAYSRRQLGMLRFELGQYAAAESLIAGSLRTYESLSGDYAEKIADDLNNLGEISRAQDHERDAERWFRRGGEIARGKLPDDAPLRVTLMNNLAALYRDLGRYADAEPLFEESLRLREKSALSSPEAIATAYLNLADVYRLQGRNTEAAPLYQAALGIARPALGAGNPALVPFVTGTAVSLEELDRVADAEPLFRQALAATERALGPDHPLVARRLIDLARLLERRGAYAAAESTYRRARDIRIARLGPRHPAAAASRVDLARCLSATPGRGDAAAALELDPAIAVLDSAGSPESRLEAHALRSAIRERAGRLDDAIAELTAALDVLDSLRAPVADAARAAFVASHRDLYHRMVALRLAAGGPDAALEAHERGRARALRDQLAASGVDMRAGIPESELAPLAREEDAARLALARAQRAIDGAPARGGSTPAQRLERMAILEGARDSAARRFERAGAAIADRSPIWRGLLTANGRPATRGEIQAGLDRGEVLVEYHVGDDGAWAFLVARDGKPARALALAVGPDAARELGIPAGPLTAAALEQVIAGDTASAGAHAASGVAELLSAAPAGAATQPGGPAALELKLQALGQVLVPRSLWERIRRAESVIVVPDGALHLLPFEALVLEPATRKRGVRYWLDDGPPVRYAASATSLVELESRRVPSTRGEESGATALSVSDPDFASHRGPGGTAGHDANAMALAIPDPSLARDGGGWPPLPGTRRETAAIRAALAPEPVVALQGAAATEAAVRAALPGFRFVHVATHGFVTERRGRVLAGLVLATGAPAPGGGESNGLLQLSEIYRLELHCELAVLSACEASRGARVAGQGVLALSRGFLAAGAQRVIASQWTVNDASTAELMSALFRDVPGADRRRRQLDWTRVLRDAKRAVRAHAQSSAPFYWAPFVLAGVR